MIILLKWHEIHDNGLSSSSVTAGNLRSVQDPTPRAAPVWEDKPQTPDFNWNFNFPQKKWGFGSGTGLDPLVQPQKTHPNLSQQREDISIHHLYPTAPGNDLRTTGSRLNLHFTSKKREKYIHEGRMGWTIIIWNQVSPSVTHSSPSAGTSRLPRLTPSGLQQGWAGITETLWKPRLDGSSEILHGVSVSDTASGLNDRTHQQEGEELTVTNTRIIKFVCYTYTATNCFTKKAK